MSEATIETNETIETCTICGLRSEDQPQDGRGVCLCKEQFGSLLVAAHREYQRNEARLRAGKEAFELLDYAIFTRSGHRLDVKGVNLTAGCGIVELHNVDVSPLNRPDDGIGPYFEFVDIRLDDIAWVGFNTP